MCGGCFCGCPPWGYENGKVRELLDILDFSSGIAHSANQLLKGVRVPLCGVRRRLGEVGL